MIVLHWDNLGMIVLHWDNLGMIVLHWDSLGTRDDHRIPAITSSHSILLYSSTPRHLRIPAISSSPSWPPPPSRDFVLCRPYLGLLTETTVPIRNQATAPFLYLRKNNAASNIIV